MVQFALYSLKGNQGIRYFPYTGYLGLTPVKVEGVVRTRLDDDGKALPSKSVIVSVRCYESRLGRLGALHTNVLAEYSQVLWSKPGDRDLGDLGDAEFPFRISLPAKGAGFSSANFQDYKVQWKVEAILHHVHISGVGSRQLKSFELPFVRYDSPPYSPPPSPPSHSRTLDLQTNKPRAPRIQYSVSPPTAPIGPMDLVSTTLHLMPFDSSVSIRSASLIVERRIQLNGTVSPPSPASPTSASSIPPSSSSQSPSSSLPQTSVLSPASASGYAPTLSYPQSLSIFSQSKGSQSQFEHSQSDLSTLVPSPTPSIYNDSESKPLLPRPAPIAPYSPPMNEVPSKVATMTVAYAESSGRFVRDDSGVWTKTLTLQWPATKSNARWAMGETMQTSLASVKFFVRAKIIVSSPSGTDSIDLDEKEILVASTNSAERQLALSKYNEERTRSRSKSKSPRRSKRDNPPESQQLPSPQSPPTASAIPPPPGLSVATSSARDSISRPSPSSATYTYHSSVPTPHQPNKPPKKSAMKRPHTSAGPRDQAKGRFGDDDRGRESDDSYRRLMLMAPRPDTSGGLPRGAKWFLAPSLGSSAGQNISSSSQSSSLGAPSSEDELPTRTYVRPLEIFPPDHVQVLAWEEELARIELQSRRSSADMLGAFKRKRATDQLVGPAR